MCICVISITVVQWCFQLQIRGQTWFHNSSSISSIGIPINCSIPGVHSEVHVLLSNKYWIHTYQSTRKVDEIHILNTKVCFLKRNKNNVNSLLSPIFKIIFSFTCPLCLMCLIYCSSWLYWLCVYMRYIALNKFDVPLFNVTFYFQLQLYTLRL